MSRFPLVTPALALLLVVGLGGPAGATGMKGPDELHVVGPDCEDFAEIPGNGRLRAWGESIGYTSPPGGPVTTHRGPLDFAGVRVQGRGCVNPEEGHWKPTNQRCRGHEVFVFSKKLVPGAVYTVGGRELKVSAPPGIAPPQVCPRPVVADPPPPPPPPPPHPAPPVPFEITDTQLWGYEDPVSHAVVLPARYAVALPFTAGGIAAVTDTDGWRYIDRNGRTVVRPWVDGNQPDLFREGLARFPAGPYVGFFDENGSVMFFTRYPYVAPFSEGLAAACQGCRPVHDGEHVRYVGGAWGYIDRAGAVAIAFVYEAAQAFEEGEARVKRDGRWFGINRAGSELVEPRPRDK